MPPTIESLRRGDRHGYRPQPRSLPPTIARHARSRRLETLIGSLAHRLRVAPLQGLNSVHRTTTTSPPPLSTMVLSRTAFGPSPEEVDIFHSLGSTDEGRWSAWIDLQLDPASIPDDMLANRLTASAYTTLDKTLYQLWTEHLLVDDDFEVRFLPALETQSAAILRAIYSRRQLVEVLADFWHNHFNVFAWHDLAGPIFVHYDRDVIRAEMLGSFRQMLEAVTAAPAMLLYLDNAFSSVDGPNENFARELLELHTLGEDAYYGAIPAADVPAGPDGVPLGYTDEDVRELARCLTGWSLDESTGAFLYRAAWHDTGAKRVVGLDLPAGLGPMEDVRRVLDRLAVHPATARFVCTKLCRRLIADTPPSSVVDAAAQTFLDTADQPDQLRQVVRTVATSSELVTSWGDKVKRPFELVVGALRAFNPQLALPVGDDATDWFFYLLFATGQLPHAVSPPTGYPDTAADWQTTNALVSSWRLINLVAGLDQDPYRICDPVGATPLGMRTPQELADYWLERVLRRTVDASTRQAIVDFMAQGSAPDAALNRSSASVHTRIQAMAGLLALLPEFQWR